MKRIIVMTAMIFGLAVTALAQKPAVVLSDEEGWTKIGQITASFETETESIVIWGSDEFEAIRLKSTDAPLNIERVQVHYHSGEIEDIQVENQLQAGSETEELHLQYPNKSIQKVSFTYHTTPNYRDEQATVELYGLKRGESKDNDNERNNNNRLRDGAADVRDDASRKADEAGDGVDRATSVIGAEIKDKVYEDKVGPNGEKIYIDEHSNYYYIDADGSKVSISKAEMRDNPKRDDQ